MAYVGQRIKTFENLHFGSDSTTLSNVLERAEYVALLRRHRGSKTLDEVADELGTRRGQLIQWEKVDGIGPGAEYAAKLADYYGDEQLRQPPRKGAKLNVSDAGLARLLDLLREAVTLLEHELGDPPA